MAGHSKWKNIQRRKNAQDARRGKIFMKLTKEIHVAAKQGGGDPESNPNLRMVIEKAKAANMPNENIERAIKKATGDIEGVNYEEMTYEGYGPGGVAVMVKVLTDNKNRSAAEIRHAFSKHGGNLGENGCVSFLFHRKGVLEVYRSETKLNEEELMLSAIDAGAEEFEANEETYVIYTNPDQYIQVKEALEKEGIPLASAEVSMIPETTTKLNDDEAVRALKLLDALEDHDDVQEVYHNLDVDEKLYEKI